LRKSHLHLENTVKICASAPLESLRTFLDEKTCAIFYYRSYDASLSRTSFMWMHLAFGIVINIV